jgi:predicted amidohydrolase YtcJ
MCIGCEWSKALGGSSIFPSSRRQVLRGIGSTVATAVAGSARSPVASAFAADQPTPARTQPPSAQDGAADWLFLGGTIHTVNLARPSAQAVAVRGTQIVYVGGADGAAAWRGPRTRIVNLAGRMLMPGFIDSHNHLASLAVCKLGVNIRGLVGKDTILDAIREWIATQPLEAPLRGHGWLASSSFGDDRPRREWLDEITGDRPMYILNADAHELWFNTAAMNAAGIGARTPDPDPGKQYYMRDPDGTPTGLAIESAAVIPICLALGMVQPEAIRASQRLTIDRAPSFGLTAYMDAGVVVGTANGAAEAVWRDLIARDERGELPIRIVGTVWTRNSEDDPQAITAELAEWNPRLRSQHVQIAICKMWTEGTATAGTALLLEPFANQPDFRGAITLSPEHVKGQVEATHRAGFDMHIHAEGDATVRIVLDAIEDVQTRLGQQGRRHTICHIALAHPDDVKRFKPLDVIANGTPLWATNYNGVEYERFARLFGAKRVEERLLPYGDIMRSGATVTFGADLPGVDIDEIPPLLQLEAAVTRKRPGFRDDPIVVARQRMSVEEAIRAYTINGAYQLRLEDEIGSIEVGKQADLIVLGASLFEIDPHDIHRVPVLLTLMDGKPWHDSLD